MPGKAKENLGFAEIWESILPRSASGRRVKAKTKPFLPGMEEDLEAELDCLEAVTTLLNDHSDAFTELFGILQSSKDPFYAIACLLYTSFNHPREITPETERACGILANAGIPLGNQSVLLRGVNNCPKVMKDLVHGLLRIRVKPYYIYQCDLTWGLEHFRTTVAEGLEIMEYLRGHTTGLAVPTYVVDAPGGGGKIPLSPNYILSMGEHTVVVRNYEGVISAYREPEYDHSEKWGEDGKCKLCGGDHAGATGVAGLLGGKKVSLVPQDTHRLERRKEYGHKNPGNPLGEIQPGAF